MIRRAHRSGGNGERFGDGLLQREHLASVPSERERLVPETSPCGSDCLSVLFSVVRKLLDPEGVIQRGCGTEQVGC